MNVSKIERFLEQLFSESNIVTQHLVRFDTMYVSGN